MTVSFLFRCFPFYTTGGRRENATKATAPRGRGGYTDRARGNYRPEKVKMDKEPRSIEEIEAELEDLRGRMPAHSVRPHMMIQLEELEDELEAAKRRAAADNG
jgi:hypothetical protein